VEKAGDIVKRRKLYNMGFGLESGEQVSKAWEWGRATIPHDMLLADNIATRKRSIGTWRFPSYIARWMRHFDLSCSTKEELIAPCFASFRAAQLGHTLVRAERASSFVALFQRPHMLERSHWYFLTTLTLTLFNATATTSTCPNPSTDLMFLEAVYADTAKKRGSNNCGRIHTL